MATNVMLTAFKHKLIVELENNITNFTNDIKYVETILRTAQNKRIRDVVMKNIEKRKKKQNDELNNFFTKYTNFILNKDENVKSSFFHGLQKEQEQKKTISGISSSCSTTASEDESHEILNDMYNRRRKLKDMLHLVKTNDEAFQGKEKPVHIFLELIQSLQNVVKESVGCEKIQQIYENAKMNDNDELKNKITENKDKKNKSDENIINYLYNENASFPEMSDFADTMMSSNSNGKISKNAYNDGTENKCMDLLADKMLNLLNQKPTTICKLNATDKSGINGLLINKTDKEFSKPNHSRVTFCHLSNGNLNQSMKKSILPKNNININGLTLKNDNPMMSNHGLNQHISFQNNIENVSHKFSDNMKADGSDFSKIGFSHDNKNTVSGLLNMEQKSHLNKEMYSEFNSSDSGNSSDSSDSSYNSDEENVDKFLGYKKHTITIDKYGKGVILVNEINGSSSKFLYDFEINYESDNEEANDEGNDDDDDDDDDAPVNKRNTQINKFKKIFQFSFLKNGTKIDNVKKLYMSKDAKIRNLEFYNKHLESDDLYSDDTNFKGLYTSKNSAFEKHIQNENTILRNELNNIINDINNNRLKSLEEEPYTEYAETNKLRGIYLHLLENQRGLEKEVNFYKNELDTLHKNLKDVLCKDNTNKDINITDFQKTQFLHKILEENFAKNIKTDTLHKNSHGNYSTNETELERQIVKLQNELKLCKDELQKEKETVVSLRKASESDKLAIVKAENELKTNEKTKEELKTLSQMCEHLMTSVDAERKQSHKLTNEVNNHLQTINDMTNKLNALKDDKSFDDFKKSVLMKVNNTNGEMHILTDRIETLTEELEIKINKENVLSEKLKKLKEKCSDNKKNLSFSRKKLKHNAILMKNMREEIDYLNEKIENLIEVVKYLKGEIKAYDSKNIKVSKSKKDENNKEIEKGKKKKKKRSNVLNNFKIM